MQPCYMYSIKIFVFLNILLYSFWLSITAILVLSSVLFYTTIQNFKHIHYNNEKNSSYNNKIFLFFCDLF